MQQSGLCILLCDYFEKDYEKTICSNQKTTVEFSANNVQERLINGLKKVVDIDIVSAPSIGCFPKECNIFSFQAFA